MDTVILLILIIRSPIKKYSYLLKIFEILTEYYFTKLRL